MRVLSRDQPETENGVAPLMVPLLIGFVVFVFEYSQNEITGAVICTSSIGRVTLRVLNDSMLTVDVMM
jgi:hypothetical protein